MKEMDFMFNIGITGSSTAPQVWGMAFFRHSDGGWCYLYRLDWNTGKEMGYDSYASWALMGVFQQRGLPEDELDCNFFFG